MLPVVIGLVFSVLPILVVGWFVVSVITALSSIRRDQARIADSLERMERAGRTSPLD